MVALEPSILRTSTIIPTFPPPALRPGSVKTARSTMAVTSLVNADW